MRYVYEPGDEVCLVPNGTRHRVLSAVEANDPVAGPMGLNLYLTLDPPGPEDTFAGTDSRRVVPVFSGVTLMEPTDMAVVAIALLPGAVSAENDAGSQARATIERLTPTMGPLTADAYVTTQVCRDWSEYERFVRWLGVSNGS